MGFFIKKILYTNKNNNFICQPTHPFQRYINNHLKLWWVSMTGFSISMDVAPKQTRAESDTQLGTLEQRLRFFMQDVTGRALVMMESATQGQQGIAMDLVQEAFISLHKSYADKNLEEWYPLFYTILNNKLQDWRRKETRRAHPFSLFKKINFDDEDEILDIIDESTPNPLTSLHQEVTMEEIQTAIRQLPIRQQQAFMLRAWEGFDTTTTAQIMGCSEGSVKTHYHRAIQGLRTVLEHLNPQTGGSSHEKR